MRRREFIGLVGSVAAAWPVAASAQQSDRMRRVGLLSGGRADDPEIQARVTAFVQTLQQMGWTDGRNVRIDYRWGEGNADHHSQIYGGIGCALARRHPDSWWAGPGAVAVR